MQVDGNGATPGTIVQTFEKGYKLGDVIIRHSKVSVAK
jgi:molecular chaperone GrpE (heat shock protein)